MGSNELLFWLSARADGSWAQFRSAVEELFTDADQPAISAQDAFPVHQQQRFNLQSLAHVEFDAEGCDDGWRVTPPVLALCRHPATTWTGVLCGARLPPTIRRFEEAADSILERQAVPGQPDVIWVAGADAEPLLALAERAGVGVQEDAPAAVLSCLLHVDELSGLHAVELPFGKDREVDRFEIGRSWSKWTRISVSEAMGTKDGLLRFKRFQIPEYFLIIAGRAHRIPGQVGKFFLLAELKKRAMRYDHRKRTVVVPGMFRPPVLIDRALVLCSGFLPEFDDKRRALTYRDIPEDIAALAADILRQPGI